VSFPRYPKYKDSGVEWLGEVPEHWGVTPLKAVASHNDDVLSEATPPDEELSYVDISSVDAASGITTTETMSFANAPSRARRKVRDGDVIVSTVRTYLRAIAAIRDPAPNLIVSTGFAVVRPGCGLHSRFLGHLLHASYFVEQVIARSTGVSYPAINASELVAISVPLPPKPEQDAIASFLDRETAKIDALVAEQQRLMELLKEKRQAVISHAVTKGLDPDAPMKPSGVEWLGEVPAHWEVIPIRKVAKLESGHTPSRSKPEYWVDCTVPWFTLADVWQIREAGLDVIVETKEQVSLLGLASSSARLLPKGTVMLSRTASVGFSAIMGVDMATTQDFANWVCGPRLLPEFLLQTLRSMHGEFRRLMMGSTHNTIYMPDIQSLTIALPPIEEQSRIAEEVKYRRNQFDTLIGEAAIAIALLHERRSALISAAVTGQIDVRKLATAEAA